MIIKLENQIGSDVVREFCWTVTEGCVSSRKEAFKFPSRTYRSLNQKDVATVSHLIMKVSLVAALFV